MRHDWLIVGGLTGVAVLLGVACGVAEASADEGRCREDFNANNYIDTGDLGALTPHFGETVPFASIYDLAPMPPNGQVDTGDLGAVTGIFGAECHGSFGTTEGEATITATQGEAVVTMTVPYYCFSLTAHRTLHPYVGNFIDADFGVVAWCQIGGVYDPLMQSTSCLAQIDVDWAPPVQNWVLVASAEQTTEMPYGYCQNQNIGHAPGSGQVPRFEMLRERGCWTAYYMGEIFENKCIGAEFPFFIYN